MYSIPLQQNNIPIQNLGSEFIQVQNINRNRGLIDPLKVDYVDFNNTTSDLYISGIANKNVLLENNYDPSEENIYTDAERQHFIANQASLQRPLTYEEKQLQQYSDADQNLDPRLRQQVVMESNLNGSNLDNSQSQDFVREIQDSVEAYNNELNLYLSKVPYTQSRASLVQELDPLNQGNPSQNLVSGLYDIIRGVEDDEERKRQERLRSRLRFVSRPTAPAGEPTRGQKPQEEKMKMEPEKKTQKVTVEIPLRPSKDEL
jgi:hypothetical protein